MTTTVFFVVFLFWQIMCFFLSILLLFFCIVLCFFCAAFDVLIKPQRNGATKPTHHWWPAGGRAVLVLEESGAAARGGGRVEATAGFATEGEGLDDRGVAPRVPKYNFRAFLRLMFGFPLLNLHCSFHLVDLALFWGVRFPFLCIPSSFLHFLFEDPHGSAYCSVQT